MEITNNDLAQQTAAEKPQADSGAKREATDEDKLAEMLAATGVSDSTSSDKSSTTHNTFGWKPATTASSAAANGTAFTTSSSSSSNTPSKVNTTGMTVTGPNGSVISGVSSSATAPTASSSSDADSLATMLMSVNLGEHKQQQQPNIGSFTTTPAAGQSIGSNSNPAATASSPSSPRNSTSSPAGSPGGEAVDEGDAGTAKALGLSAGDVESWGIEWSKEDDAAGSVVGSSSGAGKGKGKEVADDKSDTGSEASNAELAALAVQVPNLTTSSSKAMGGRMTAENGQRDQDLLAGRMEKTNVSAVNGANNNNKNNCQSTPTTTASTSGPPQGTTFKAPPPKIGSNTASQRNSFQAPLPKLPIFPTNRHPAVNGSRYSTAYPQSSFYQAPRGEPARFPTSGGSIAVPYGQSSSYQAPRFQPASFPTGQRTISLPITNWSSVSVPPTGFPNMAPKTVNNPLAPANQFTRPLPPTFPQMPPPPQPRPAPPKMQQTAAGGSLTAAHTQSSFYQMLPPPFASMPSGHGNITTNSPLANSMSDSSAAPIGFANMAPMPANSIPAQANQIPAAQPVFQQIPPPSLLMPAPPKIQQTDGSSSLTTVHTLSRFLQMPPPPQASMSTGHSIIPANSSSDLATPAGFSNMAPMPVNNIPPQANQVPPSQPAVHQALPPRPTLAPASVHGIVNAGSGPSIALAQPTVSHASPLQAVGFVASHHAPPPQPANVPANSQQAMNVIRVPAASPQSATDQGAPASSASFDAGIKQTTTDSSFAAAPTGLANIVPVPANNVPVRANQVQPSQTVFHQAPARQRTPAAASIQQSILTNVGSSVSVPATQPVLHQAQTTLPASKPTNFQKPVIGSSNIQQTTNAGSSLPATATQTAFHQAPPPQATLAPASVQATMNAGSSLSVTPSPRSVLQAPAAQAMSVPVNFRKPIIGSSNVNSVTNAGSNVMVAATQPALQQATPPQHTSLPAPATIQRISNPSNGVSAALQKPAVHQGPPLQPTSLPSGANIQQTTSVSSLPPAPTAPQNVAPKPVNHPAAQVPQPALQAKSAEPPASSGFRVISIAIATNGTGFGSSGMDVAIPVTVLPQNATYVAPAPTIIQPITVSHTYVPLGNFIRTGGPIAVPVARVRNSSGVVFKSRKIPPRMPKFTAWMILGLDKKRKAEDDGEEVVGLLRNFKRPMMRMF